MMLLRTFAALLLCAVVAGACSSGDDAADALNGNEYVSTVVTQDGERYELTAGTTIMLGFNEGSLRASAGCNSIGGAFDIQDGELRATDLSMTEMGCDPERMAQDDFLINVLTSAPAITIDGDSLRLETAAASIDLIDASIANPDRPLQGTTWEIDGFLSGDTASSFATDVRGTVRIDNESMQLFDGCASTELSVEIADDTISFTPIGMPTAEDCAAPPGYRQSIYTALSRGSLAFSIEGTSLTLATPDNVGFTLKAVE